VKGAVSKGVKRPGREADYYFASTARNKYEWKCRPTWLCVVPMEERIAFYFVRRQTVVERLFTIDQLMVLLVCGLTYVVSVTH
jgi:hypothetical protein